MECLAVQWLTVVNYPGSAYTLLLNISTVNFYNIRLLIYFKTKSSYFCSRKKKIG